MKQVKTYIPKPAEIEHKYYVIDASDKILGHIATKAASILRGKHKRIFTPHLDTGDRVIVINAGKIRISGTKKGNDKIYQRYTGYPSGRRTVTFNDMLKKAPTKVIRLAVNRMLPKGALGNSLRTRLHVYVTDKHPHMAQKPISLTV